MPNAMYGKPIIGDTNATVSMVNGIWSSSSSWPERNAPSTKLTRTWATPPIAFPTKAKRKARGAPAPL